MSLIDAWRRALDRRVHALYLIADQEARDDEEFVFLHSLRVECDPECNRLVRAINAYELRHPEAA